MSKITWDKDGNRVVTESDDPMFMAGQASRQQEIDQLNFTITALYQDAEDEAELKQATIDTLTQERDRLQHWFDGAANLADVEKSRAAQAEVKLGEAEAQRVKAKQALGRISLGGLDIEQAMQIAEEALR